MTRPGEQNAMDLGRIVDEINAIYAKGGVDFVFIPGDIADNGSVVAYETVRQHLDRLELPWCGIVGDYDVHEKSFDNFRHYISDALYSRFTIGPYRFIRLNAFSTPKPDSFSLGEEQLQWLEQGLQECKKAGDRAVLLLHCYPSDLKQGGEELKSLLRKYPILLVDMGHTHYNELSNDGHTLYSATRSTGQIEEGPVGYSVTTIDHDAVSWYFVELGSPELLAITYPQDERLITNQARPEPSKEVSLRVKTWPSEAVSSVSVQVGPLQTTLSLQEGLIWQGKLDVSGLSNGTHALEAVAVRTHGEKLSTSIRMRVGPMPQREFAEIDQENAIGEWSERGLLGTQLGPNKNGKKW
jgi:predicted phosphodiesterase